VSGDVIKTEEGVIGDPDRVETGILGAAGHGKDVAPVADAVAHRAVAIGDVETDLERSFPCHGHAEAFPAVPRLIETVGRRWYWRLSEGESGS
jgi:hypothetical protein